MFTNFCYFQPPRTLPLTLFVTRVKEGGMKIHVKLMCKGKGKVKGKIKGKVHPRTGHEGPEGE
jgi:hypothetical protein